MQTFRYVRHGEKKELLIDFLCIRFPYNGREDWLRNIANGSLTLNDFQAEPDRPLETGDLIGYLRPRSEEPWVDRDIALLYEDDAIVVVSKNANIPVSESGRYYRNTLVNVLKENFQFPELYAVHRLDRETSGLMVLSKDLECTRILGKYISEGKMGKSYQALLLGKMPENEIIVDAPIKKNPRTSEVHVRQIVHPEGKKAKTLFSKTWNRKGLTFSEIKPLTGRTHQIRVHAEHIGFPILGDKLYGRTDQEFIRFVQNREEPAYEKYGTVPRQMLHASHLTFHHPKTQKILSFHRQADPEFAKFPKIKALLA